MSTVPTVARIRARCALSLSSQCPGGVTCCVSRLTDDVPEPRVIDAGHGVPSTAVSGLDTKKEVTL